jgi:sugar (pentulose or hexulose) kinase
LKADITGLPLHGRNLGDASSLGAALLAGSATDVYTGLDEACDRTAAPARTFLPDPARHAIYAERLETYASLYEKLSGVAQALRQ